MCIPPNAKASYNYCGICGRVPQDSKAEPNWGPIRWWDCDDGWKIGTLCRWCNDEVAGVKPHKDDYAYKTKYDIRDENIETDEDPTDVIGFD